MLNQFFSLVTLSRSFSSYFVTLFHKIAFSFQLGDCRLICLLGSLYKLVAKMLASRLAKVMDKLISLMHYQLSLRGDS